MRNPSIAFFQYLSRSHTQWILEHSKERALEAGDLLLRQGQPIQEISFVMNGLFRISGNEGGERHTLDQVGAGGIIGEMALIEDLISAVEVHALEPSQVLSLSKQVITSQFQSRPGFAAEISKAVALSALQRLREVN